VQGSTRPDPDEAALLLAPHPRTVRVEPPTAWAETCNIVYPRDVLEAFGGFDERGLPLLGGEDSDLALRARAAGVRYAAAPEAVTFHMVDTMSLWRRAAFAWRWRQIPAMVRRHPVLRREGVLGVFWKPRHGWFALALGGLLASRRSPAAALLVLPWVRAALPSYGSGVRGRVRSAAELPGQATVDAVEVAALAVGSVRARTLFL
jgi:GT2 family glycosyltransferase